MQVRLINISEVSADSNANNAHSVGILGANQAQKNMCHDVHVKNTHARASCAPAKPHFTIVSATFANTHARASRAPANPHFTIVNATFANTSSTAAQSTNERALQMAMAVGNSELVEEFQRRIEQERLVAQNRFAILSPDDSSSTTTTAAMATAHRIAASAVAAANIDVVVDSSSPTYADVASLPASSTSLATSTTIPSPSTSLTGIPVSSTSLATSTTIPSPSTSLTGIPASSTSLKHLPKCDKWASHGSCDCTDDVCEKHREFGGSTMVCGCKLYHHSICMSFRNSECQYRDGLGVCHCVENKFTCCPKQLEGKVCKFNHAHPKNKKVVAVQLEMKQLAPTFEQLQSMPTVAEANPRPSTPALLTSRSSTPAPRPSTPAPRPSTPAPRPSTPAPRPSTPAPRPSTPLSIIASPSTSQCVIASPSTSQSFIPCSLDEGEVEKNRSHLMGVIGEMRAQSYPSSKSRHACDLTILEHLQVYGENITAETSDARYVEKWHELKKLAMECMKKPYGTPLPQQLSKELYEMLTRLNFIDTPHAQAEYLIKEAKRECAMRPVYEVTRRTEGNKEAAALIGSINAEAENGLDDRHGVALPEMETQATLDREYAVAMNKWQQARKQLPFEIKRIRAEMNEQWAYFKSLVGPIELSGLTVKINGITIHNVCPHTFTSQQEPIAESSKKLAMTNPTHTRCGCQKKHLYVPICPYVLKYGVCNAHEQRRCCNHNHPDDFKRPSANGLCYYAVKTLCNDAICNEQSKGCSEGCHHGFSTERVPIALETLFTRFIDGSITPASFYTFMLKTVKDHISILDNPRVKSWNIDRIPAKDITNEMAKDVPRMSRLIISFISCARKLGEINRVGLTETDAIAELFVHGCNDRICPDHRNMMIQMFLREPFNNQYVCTNVGPTCWRGWHSCMMPTLAHSLNSGAEAIVHELEADPYRPFTVCHDDFVSGRCKCPAPMSKEEKIARIQDIEMFSLFRNEMLLPMVVFLANPRSTKIILTDSEIEQMASDLVEYIDCNSVEVTRIDDIDKFLSGIRSLFPEEINKLRQGGKVREQWIREQTFKDPIVLEGLLECSDKLRQRLVKLINDLLTNFHPKLHFVQDFGFASLLEYQHQGAVAPPTSAFCTISSTALPTISCAESSAALPAISCAESFAESSAAQPTTSTSATVRFSSLATSNRFEVLDEKDEAVVEMVDIQTSHVRPVESIVTTTTPQRTFASIAAASSPVTVPSSSPVTVPSSSPVTLPSSSPLTLPSVRASSPSSTFVSLARASSPSSTFVSLTHASSSGDVYDDDDDYYDEDYYDEDEDYSGEDE
jgi:hypothetical protein